jgi:Integrase core domain
VYVERLIGTIRRECLDHVIVFGEAHLRRILGRYAAYYNESRIHRSLDKDAPFHRAIERFGVITACPRRPSSPILQNLIFGTHNVSRRKGAPECSEFGIAGAPSAVQAHEKSITVFAAAVAHAVAPAVG